MPLQIYVCFFEIKFCCFFFLNSNLYFCEKQLCVLHGSGLHRAFLFDCLTLILIRMEKRVLKSAAALLVALGMASTAGVQAQGAASVAPSRDGAGGESGEQMVKYQIPANAYFSSADPGHYPTVPYVDPPFPYYYKLRIISPTNNEILFTDVSEGVAGEPQWSVNTTENDPDNDGLPIGEATSLEADENGNLLYFVGEQTDNSDFGPGDYRFPILTYGDQSYDFSQISKPNVIGTRDQYTKIGIQTVKDRAPITMINLFGRLPYTNFNDNRVYGGINSGKTWPQVSSETGAEGLAGHELGKMCDGDAATYYEPNRELTLNDLIVIDLGKIVVMNDLRIIFTDEQHVLKGSARIMVSSTPSMGGYSLFAMYDSDQVEGNVFECTGSGGGRYIMLMFDELDADGPVPQIAEIEGHNIEVWKESNMTEIAYPIVEVENESALYNCELGDLIDDDASSQFYYAGAQQVDDQIVIDYGENVARNAIRVNFNGGDIPNKAVIELSADREEWTQIGEPFGITGSGQYWVDDVLPSTIKLDAEGMEARYLRFRITEPNPGHWLQISDIVVEGARQFVVSMVDPDSDPIMDKIITFYPKPMDPFYVDQISMFATTASKESDVIIPEGSYLTLQITTITDDGLPGDVIAETRIGSDGVTRSHFSAGGVKAWALDAYFYDESGEKTGVLLDSDFAIVVSGIGEDTGSGIDLGFMFNGDYAHQDDFYGRAMFTMLPGAEGYEAGKLYDYGAYNLWWNIFGKFITLRPAIGEEAIILPGGGGKVESTIYVSCDDYTIDTPAWLSCEIVPEEGKTAATLVSTADPMDVIGESRTGQIEITSAEGVKCVIDVTQSPLSGVGNVGVAETKVTGRNGHVTVEYAAGMERVEVYNAQGVCVGRHVLPAGGGEYSFDVDADGLYIIKVSGADDVYVGKLLL